MSRGQFVGPLAQGARTPVGGSHELASGGPLRNGRAGGPLVLGRPSSRLTWAAHSAGPDRAGC